MLPLAFVCVASFAPSATTVRPIVVNRIQPVMSDVDQKMLQQLRDINGQILRQAAELEKSAKRATPVEYNVRPLPAFFAGGGAVGIGYAAYCTSSGSPPTGLAIAFASCLFMAAGGALLEMKGS